MSARLGLFVLILSGVVAGGCGLRRPNFLDPGDVRTQQFGAVIHDPYMDNDAGPEVPEVRPREYDKPLPEPRRGRLYRESQFFPF